MAKGTGEKVLQTTAEAISENVNAFLDAVRELLSVHFRQVQILYSNNPSIELSLSAYREIRRLLSNEDWARIDSRLLVIQENLQNLSGTYREVVKLQPLVLVARHSIEDLEGVQTLYGDVSRRKRQ